MMKIKSIRKRNQQENILMLGSGIDLLRGLPKRSVSLIITDPPYPKEFQHLYGQMAKEASRVLKIGGSLVTLCGQHQMLDVGKDISNHLRYWWCGGMLHTTLQRLPGKWVCITGKSMLWFVKKRRMKKDTECPIDYLKGGGKDKRFHLWGQPILWFQHWIERLSKPGDLIVDPFVGGGTVAVAAINLKRRYACAEIDPETHAVASKRIAKRHKGFGL